MTNKNVDDINGNSTVTLWDFYSKHPIFITQTLPYRFSGFPFCSFDSIRFSPFRVLISCCSSSSTGDADVLGSTGKPRVFSVIFCIFLGFYAWPRGILGKDGMVDSTHTQLKIESLGCGKWVSGLIFAVVSGMFFLKTSATSESDISGC